MNSRAAPATGTPTVVVRDQAPGPAEFRADVIRGMTAPVRSVPCKYLYDDRGAALFEAICGLDVYYLTRAERSIFDAHLPEIAARLGPRCRVVELGSGSAAKTRRLLAGLAEPTAYVPVDLARAQLVTASVELARRFPGLEVTPLCADYTGDLVLPAPARRPRRSVVFFPGSTIGNFEPAQAVAFLARAARLCGPDGGMLIGVDRQKDRATLERAYNDPDGVTAAFNLNLLVRINRELGADFDVAGFAHRAVYNETAGRIEMHLVSRRPQTVCIPRPEGGDAIVRFHSGDVVVTEHSYKYTVPGFTRLAVATRWQTERVWSDRAHRFSVFCLRVPAQPRA